MTPHSTRRDFIALSATAALAAAVSAQAQPAPAAPTGPFTLAPLPYAKDALLPHIDALTMDIHHSKHHQAYVNGLNTALKSETAFLAQAIDPEPAPDEPTASSAISDTDQMRFCCHCWLRSSHISS